MASRGVIHKKKTAGFGNLEERRIVRAIQERENRRHRRSTVFDTRRAIPESEGSSASAANNVETTKPQQGQREVQTEDRRTKLLKWRAEKELQKKIQQQKKPPIFRTGVYHHKLNSPVFLHQLASVPEPAKSAVTQRITRATAKRIAAKQNGTVNRTGPMAPKKASKATKSDKSAPNVIISEKSFAPDNYQFKAPEGLPNLPLFGREALDEIKTEPETPPVYFSPYVVSARGKKASRKEQLQNIELAEYQVERTSPKESNAQSVGTSNDGEELTPSYFRSITDKEVSRLRALCQHWTIVKTDDTLSEDSQLIINQAIGQTNLLINKKIEQFRQLIFDCENRCGEQLVTCQDLQGFWDMVYMQVEDCDSRFNKLTVLQGRDWKEEEPVAKKVTATKKTTATKKIIPSKSSSVRDMIRAARRKQMESQRIENAHVTIVGESSGETTGESSRLSAIKFDGGFFMVESPKKVVTPRSVRKSTLLQQPAFSGESKLRNSALSLMRLSQKLKPPEIKPVEIECDPTIPYINSRQTPGKGILKRTDTQESLSCIKKSQNKVNFSKNQETPKDNTKMSWFDQSIKVTSPSGENLLVSEIQLNAKKKLDLSDFELDFEEVENQQEITSQIVHDLRVKFIPEKVLNVHENVEEKSSEVGNVGKNVGTKPEDCGSLSPLRNDPGNVIKAVRRSRRVVLTECNEETVPECSNIHGNKPDSNHIREDSTAHEHQKENEKPNSPEITKRRRSTRRSVRFTGDDCTACAEAKPTYPMTPRSKRKSSKLLESQNVSENRTAKTKVQTPPTQNSDDLILWDTPKDPPPRVRRSLRIQNSKQ